MEAFILLSVICIALGLAFLIPALLSRDPRNLRIAVGKLSDSKKVPFRGNRFITHKDHVTAATYLYEADGRTYRLKYSGFVSRSSLMGRVTVVYLRFLPRFGYLDRYPAGMFIYTGIFCILAGLAFLTMPYWV